MWRVWYWKTDLNEFKKITKLCQYCNVTVAFKSFLNFVLYSVNLGVTIQLKYSKITCYVKECQVLSVDTSENVKGCGIEKSILKDFRK